MKNNSKELYGSGPCPVDCLLVQSMRDYMKVTGIKEAFFADQIMCQQIIDIPSPSERIHFDETNTINALENNRKHLNRWLNGENHIPLRIVPTILRVIRLFPQIKQNKMDDFGHLNKTVQENLEAIETYRKAIEDGTINPDEAQAVWKEGFEGICALLGMMFYAKAQAERTGSAAVIAKPAPGPPRHSGHGRI